MVEWEGVGPLLGEKRLLGLRPRGASLVRSQQGRWRSVSSERDPSESFELPAETSDGLVSYTAQNRTEVVLPVGP